ncbi:MAG TPA: response regulator [Bacillota bacterium]|nr:response regulator [Bacillota bacterium]
MTTDTESKYILVVDDQMGVRRLLYEAFNEQGYQVGLAANGPEALDKINERWPDVILMDMKMPGMSGLEVLRALKERPGDPKVILMTAYGELEIVAEAMALGVTEYVTKPFDINEVRELVRKVIQ